LFFDFDRVIFDRFSVGRVSTEGGYPIFRICRAVQMDSPTYLLMVCPTGINKAGDG